TAATSSLHRQGNLADLCFSLQETAFAMLSEAVERSLVQTRRSEVLLAGGVAASSRLREMIGSVAEDHGASFHPVPVEYSGDCGAQIACSGRLAFNSGITISKSAMIGQFQKHQGFTKQKQGAQEFPALLESIWRTTLS